MALGYHHTSLPCHHHTETSATSPSLSSSPGSSTTRTTHSSGLTSVPDGKLQATDDWTYMYTSPSSHAQYTTKATGTYPCASDPPKAPSPSTTLHRLPARAWPQGSHGRRTRPIPSRSMRLGRRDPRTHCMASTKMAPATAAYAY